MKSTLKQISAFVFALLVIGSTTATAMSFHLCGGAVTDTAFYKEADGCGMHHHSKKSDEPMFSKKPCCVNDNINVNNDISIVVEKQHSVDAPVFIYNSDLIIVKSLSIVDHKVSINNYNHSPPLIKYSLFKKYQVYRI